MNIAFLPNGGSDGVENLIKENSPIGDEGWNQGKQLASFLCDNIPYVGFAKQLLLKEWKKPTVDPEISSIVASYHYHTNITNTNITNANTNITNITHIDRNTLIQSYCDQKKILIGDFERITKQSLMNFSVSNSLESSLVNFSSTLIDYAIGHPSNVGIQKIISGTASLITPIIVSKISPSIASCVPFIGPLITIFSGFLSLFNDDANNEISYQLSVITNNIMKLGNYIKERFDIVDKKLDHIITSQYEIHKQTMNVLNQVFFKIRTNHMELITLIRSQTNTINHSLDLLKNTITNVIANTTRVMHDGFSQQTQHLLFIEQKHERNIERDALVAIRQNCLIDPTIGTELYKNIIIPDESPFMIGADIDFNTNSNTNSKIETRLLTPYFDGATNKNQLAFSMIHAIFRYSNIKYDASHPKLFENRIFIYLSLLRKIKIVPIEFEKQLHDISSMIDSINIIMNKFPKSTFVITLKKSIIQKLRDYQMTVNNILNPKQKCVTDSNAKEYLEYFNNTIVKTLKIEIPYVNKSFFQKLDSVVPYSSYPTDNHGWNSLSIICQSYYGSQLYKNQQYVNTSYQNKKYVNWSGSGLGPAYPIVSSIGSTPAYIDINYNGNCSSMYEYGVKNINSPTLFCYPSQDSKCTIRLIMYNYREPKGIPTEFLDNNRGVVKLYYDASFGLSNTLNVIIWGQFEFYESDEIVEIFRQNITTPIIKEFYKSLDCAVHNWHTGYIYKYYSKIPNQVSSLHYKYDVPQSLSDYIGPLYMFNSVEERSENCEYFTSSITPHHDCIKKFFESQQKILRKKESDIKLIDTTDIEKEIVILSLFTHIYGNKRFDFNERIKITNIDNVINLVQNISTDDTNYNYDNLWMLKKYLIETQQTIEFKNTTEEPTKDELMNKITNLESKMNQMMASNEMLTKIIQEMLHKQNDIKKS